MTTCAEQSLASVCFGVVQHDTKKHGLYYLKRQTQGLFLGLSSCEGRLIENTELKGLSRIFCGTAEAESFSKTRGLDLFFFFGPPPTREFVTLCLNLKCNVPSDHQNTEHRTHKSCRIFIEFTHKCLTFSSEGPWKRGKVTHRVTDLEKNPKIASITIFRTSFDALWEGMHLHNTIADKTHLECGPYVLEYFHP